MSDAYLIRRGGGLLSVNAAVLHITASAASTVTLVKGGVTVAVLASGKGHTNAADNTMADWYYTVDAGNYGEWTITATEGTKTAGKTVTVDANKEYDVLLSYNVYIIQNGVLLYEVASKSASLSVSSANGYYQIKGSSAGSNMAIYFGDFNVGGFSKAVCEVLYCYAAKREQVRVRVGNTVMAYREYYSDDDVTSHENQTWELDMSGITSSVTGQLGLFRNVTIGNELTIRITNLYMIPA